MLAGDEAGARALDQELLATEDYLESEGEAAPAAFLHVLRAVLRHAVPDEAARLPARYGTALSRLLTQVRPPAQPGQSSRPRWLARLRPAPPTLTAWQCHQRAMAAQHSLSQQSCRPVAASEYERIFFLIARRARCPVLKLSSSVSLPLAQVQGSGWRLDVEGRPSGPGAGEPRFSTWDEVLSGRAGAKQGASPAGTAGAPVELAYYNALGVAPSASQVEIKAAYRAQALRLHPDVSDAPNATQRFTELAQAYGVHCAVLCCAVLCCAVLCCAVLCCDVMCCAVLCCDVLCCAVLCRA